jgi:hypothetical protein
MMTEKAMGIQPMIFRLNLMVQFICGRNAAEGEPAEFTPLPIRRWTIPAMQRKRAQPLLFHTTEYPHGYAAYHVVDYAICNCVGCAICYCAGYGVEFGDTAKYSIISNKNQRAFVFLIDSSHLRHASTALGMT